MSLSLIKDRFEQNYYRQIEGFLGDVDTLANNAKDFNGDDSPVGMAAAGTSHAPVPSAPTLSWLSVKGCLRHNKELTMTQQCL